MEQGLKELKEFYEVLFRQYPDAVHLLDTSGRFLCVNPAWEKISGYPAQELLRTSFSGLIAAEDFKRISQHFENVIKGGQPNDEIPIRRKDGRRIELKLHHIPVVLDSGVACFFGVAKDITEHKQMEERLFFQTSLLDQVRSAVVATDSDGKIVFWNKFAERLYQWKAEEVMGKRLADIMSPKLITTLRQSGYWEGEFLAEKKDGTFLVSFLTNTVIRDTNGRISGTVCVATDITERKRSEEEKERLQAQLRQAQKMESIGTIASGVAHNFNNVMAAILGNSQLIQVHSHDPTIQGYAKMIDKQILRGSGLVNRLMQFSRMQQRTELTTVNLVDSITEVYHIVSRSFDKRIEIEIDLPPSLIIQGDPAGLTQVFMNICTNARDAMPDGGRLRIEASQERDRAVVIISDTGHGIDQETLERIFDPFFTTKEVGKGTGLGLSTAYGIIESCGGEIRVDSELGKGTTFTIHLPLAERGGTVAVEPTGEIVSGRGEKVLIVDDDPDILETFSEVVQNLGYEVCSATGGEEAIERYTAWRPDVTLIDRNMPGMDGIRCAKRILEADPHARIIIASGYAEHIAPEIDETTRAAIKDYITKPFRTEELSRVLAQALKG